MRATPNRPRWTAGALAVLLCTAAFAQADDAAMAAKRDAKLAEPWVTNAPWITEFDKAKKEAKDQGKHLFTYFTRSYSP